ncbi:MAG TPA: PilZ domain-containing protein [Blastococcus sp.]
MIDFALDRPRVSTSADVTLVSRGVTVTARVDVSGADRVVVGPAGDGPIWPADTVAAGDAAELYWIGAEEEWTLAGTVAEVEDGGRSRWHIAVAGPAERSQRRRAVRARVEVPVLIPWAGAVMTGTTVDLSESGMRALMDAWGVPPEPSTPAKATLTLDDTTVELHGEIVWTSTRGPRWLMAMKFLRVPEMVGDRLRRRVFQALRDERAAAAG